MARIHSIQIFYASSNPALSKILLKFSDGEGGILTKSVKGRFFLGIWTSSAWTGSPRTFSQKWTHNYLIYFWGKKPTFRNFSRIARGKSVQRGGNRFSAAEAVQRGEPVYAAFFCIFKLILLDWKNMTSSLALLIRYFFVFIILWGFCVFILVELPLQ